MEFAKEIAKEADLYNPFNLVVADLCSKIMVFVSNRPEGEPTIETVNPGIHVLSNASLDSPWPKVAKFIYLCSISVQIRTSIFL